MESSYDTGVDSRSLFTITESLPLYPFLHIGEGQYHQGHKYLCEIFVFEPNNISIQGI